MAGRARWGVVAALLIGCGPRGHVPAEEELKPPPCAASTGEDLQEGQMLALGGHLHRALALGEAADARCSSPDSRWLIAEVLTDLGLDARATAAYQRFLEVAETDADRQSAREKLDELAKRPPPSRAASDDDRQTAILLYRDGVNLRLGGKPDDAIRQLRRSYALVPHPLTIVQIALAHQDAGRAVEARKTHERALAIAEMLTGEHAVARPQRGHVARIDLLAWSRDGRRMATASRDGTIKLWDAATGRLVHTFPLPHPASLAISGDGLVVAAVGEDGRGAVWDGISGDQVSQFEVAADWFPRVAVSDDGRWLAFAGHGGAGVSLRATGGGATTTLAGGRSYHGFVFSPDGSRLAMQYGNSVELWQRDPPRKLVELGSLAGKVQQVAFSPDGGRLAVADQSGAVTIWDTTGGRKLRATEHAHTAQGVAWSGDGATLAACGGRRLRIWSAASLEVKRDIDAPAVAVALSPDGGTVAAVGNSSQVHTWDIATGNYLRAIGTRVVPVTGVGATADGRQLVVAGGDGNAYLWRLDAVREPHAVDVGGDVVTALAVDPRGRWLATIDDNRVAWLVDAGGRRLGNPVADVAGLAAAPDGSLLATVGGEDVMLWRTSDGARARSTRWTDPRSFAAVAFSPGGERMVFGGASSVHVRLTRGADELEAPVPSPVTAVAWAPDGQQWVSGHDDGSIRVWAADQTVPLRTIPGHQGAVHALGFAPDGALLASAGADGMVALWDPATGARHGATVEHAADARALTFVAGGRLLASAGDDGVVELERVDTGAAVATLSVSGEQWLVLADDGRIDGAAGRSGGAGLVYWQVGAIALPGVTGWDRARAPGLLPALVAEAQR